MTFTIRTITFDAGDPHRLATFWSQVTGYAEDPANPNSPEDEAQYLVGPAGSPALLFIRVPEAKAGKNRVHLDVGPQDRTRDAEVEWLLTLGATVVDDRRNADGTGWVVMGDPEGNEFCVERSDAERTSP